MAEKSEIEKKVPSAPTVEIGASGLQYSAGIVDEEFLAQLKWPKSIDIYKEMSSNDPVIGAMLFAIEMLIRQVEWKVEPAEDSEQAREIAQFVESCFHDMEMSWEETISEIITFLHYGFSINEIVYKRRMGPRVTDKRFKSKFNDGRYGWRKLAPRAQDTITEFVFDDKGGLKEVVQQIPTSFKEVRLPRDKFLLFRANSRKDNPTSTSVLRTAYRPWYFKKKIEEFEAIGVERDLAGLPIAKIPAAYMSPYATSEQKAVYETVKKIVTSIRKNEQAGVVWPLEYTEDGKEMFKIELLSANSPAKLYNTEEIIQRYNANIAQTMLADFILLGQKSVGSFALSSDKTRMFAVAIGAWLGVIASVFNTHAIPQLLEINDIDPALTPKLVHGDIEARNPAEIADYFSKLALGSFINQDTNLENWLRDQVGAPLTSNADYTLPSNAEPVETNEDRRKDRQIESSENIAEMADQKKPQEIDNRADRVDSIND